MLIIRDTTGVTIKRTIQSMNHVRIGVLQVAFWVNGVRQFVRDIGKPHGEFDINDCADLLEVLEHLERMDCF